MTHKPGHQEDGCPKCVINRVFLAIAMRLFLKTIGPEHALRQDAEFLGSQVEACAAATSYAIEIGLLESPDASDWNGCDRATEVMTWEAGLRETPEMSQEAEFRAAAMMRKWGEEYASVTLALVAGKKGE